MIRRVNQEMKMKPQNLTTENTEKISFKYSKNSVNSMGNFNVERLKDGIKILIL